VGVENDELHVELARLRALAETSVVFSRTATDYRGLLDAVAERIAAVTGDSCMVSLISEDGAWLDKVAIHGPDVGIKAISDHLFSTPRLRVGEGATGMVARTGVTMMMPVTAEQLRALAGPDIGPTVEQFAITSILIVPLSTSEATIGTVSLARHGDRPPHGDRDRRLAEDLAARASLAIDNSRLYHDLQRSVADRTAIGEAAQRELDAFSYSVSHDLRSPLRAIDGFARILVEDHGGALDQEGRRLLDVICTNVTKMGTLIDALLTFSRIGRTTLDHEVIDMAALARSAADEVRAGEMRPIELAIGPLPPARCDPTLIRQVWLNLLGNAVKYTRDREPAKIEVAGEARNDELVYVVRDNGVGFDMKYVAKLFGAFQRLHSTRRFEGTGIGLAIVQRIVHLHGGRVWAEGEVERGATFSFALPALLARPR